MKVLFLSSFSKSLVWFRMNLMDELVAAGHEVFALGDDDDPKYEIEFRKHDVTYRSFPVSRNGLSPIEDVRTYLALRRAIGEIAPDKVFVYQAKTIVYGTPAVRRAGNAEVYPLVAGLGSVLRSGALRNRLIQSVLRVQYRRAFRQSERVFFQNPDDRGEFVALRLLPAEKTVMINGSGVDLQHFAQAPLPETPVFLFVGRLLRDKGVVEYLDACREIKQRHPEVRCLLVGPFDTNPTSLQVGQLEPYVVSGAVEYLGEQTDVRPSIARSSVFVLPSYHEGTPKSVLEAMAMGRAIITTNAPGCRETVVEGVNGQLVEPRNTGSLVAAMERLLEDRTLAPLMGEASRKMAEDRFDVRKVNAVIMGTMGLGQTARSARN